jgi:hypothetical protein
MIKNNMNTTITRLNFKVRIIRILRKIFDKQKEV